MSSPHDQIETRLPDSLKLDECYRWTKFDGRGIWIELRNTGGGTLLTFITAVFDAKNVRDIQGATIPHTLVRSDKVSVIAALVLSYENDTHAGNR